MDMSSCLTVFILCVSDFMDFAYESGMSYAVIFSVYNYVRIVWNQGKKVSK